MGKPIICSDMPVLKEVLEDGLNCVLCGYDDIETWSENIKKLHDNKEWAKRLSKEALLTLEKYTWNQRAIGFINNVFIKESDFVKRRGKNTLRYVIFMLSSVIKLGIIIIKIILKRIWKFFFRPLYKITKKIFKSKMIIRGDEVAKYKVFKKKDKHVFFSYYDLPQIDNTGDKMLIHAVNKDADPGNDTAEIGYFCISDGSYRKITTTKAWCWQQGSRLRWNPTDSGEIFYNDIEDDQYVTKRKN